MKIISTLRLTLTFTDQTSPIIREQLEDLIYELRQKALRIKETKEDTFGLMID
jgi:hypothetical protein